MNVKQTKDGTQLRFTDNTTTTTEKKYVWQNRTNKKKICYFNVFVYVCMVYLPIGSFSRMSAHVRCYTWTLRKSAIANRTPKWLLARLQIQNSKEPLKLNGITRFDGFNSTSIFVNINSNLHVCARVLLNWLLVRSFCYNRDNWNLGLDFRLDQERKTEYNLKWNWWDFLQNQAKPNVPIWTFAWMRAEVCFQSAWPCICFPT